MKHTLLFALSLALAMPALAQPNRAAGDAQDVVWARDIGSATITLDGELNEPEWAQAESVNIKWGAPVGLPGSGQFFETNPAGFTDPADPIDAVLSFLRKGNDLYIAVNAKDKSVGGARGLWNMDGVFISTVNKSKRPGTYTDYVRYNGFQQPNRVRQELFYSWWNGRDTTATGEVEPGISPFGRSTFYGGDLDDSTQSRVVEAWDYAHSVTGLANDDLNGGASPVDDEGYIFEMKINVDSLGWDFTQPMARMPLTIAIQDTDYAWPVDENQFVSTRAWWQGRWGNNLSEGAAYVAADPSVTVSSGAVPEYTEPEFTVGNGNARPAPTIDGSLDEGVWEDLDPQFKLQYQMTDEFRDANLPGVLAPNYAFYWLAGSENVIEPSVGTFKMFYRGSKLYVGLDAADQAINGQEGEGGRDGFRLLIRSLDSLNGSLQFTRSHVRMDLSIDSTGAIRFTNVSEEVEVGTDLVAAVSLNSGSTVADPSDIDAGYQMEMELDLTAIGYPEDLNGEQIWIALNYFDGDALSDDTQSYGTRTWIVGERTNGASIYGYLDPTATIGVASEDEASGALFRSFGAAPNPSSGLTQLRYELPQATDVTVEIFDVLGRSVQTLEVGPQAEGLQSVEIDGAALGAGTYLYRVSMQDGASVTGRMTIVR